MNNYVVLLLFAPNVKGKSVSSKLFTNLGQTWNKNMVLDRVRKSILYEKINLTQKKFVSKLSCKQTARLLFSYLL